jgi:hypothetical protein
MIGYRYDSEGFVLGQIIIQESPLEPGVYSIPPNATTIIPPSTQENEIAYWNGNNWEIKPDFSNKTYYDKATKEEKKLEKGQSITNNYTEIHPLENERFQKWDEDSNSWIIDIEKKNDFELQIRQSTIQKLLLESDYVELPSFIERKGQETYNLWMTYRNNLRAAYHNIEVPLPQKPE